MRNRSFAIRMFIAAFLMGCLAASSPIATTLFSYLERALGHVKFTVDLGHEITIISSDDKSMKLFWYQMGQNPVSTSDQFYRQMLAVAAQRGDRGKLIVILNEDAPWNSNAPIEELLQQRIEVVVPPPRNQIRQNPSLRLQKKLIAFE